MDERAPLRAHGHVALPALHLRERDLMEYRAAEAGLGAMILGDVRHRFSGSPRLVRLDLELGTFGQAELHLVCARSALDTARVRVVADLLTAELEKVISGAGKGS